MFHLAVICTQLIYIKVTRPFACVGFVPLHVLVYVVLPTCFILSNQVCTCGFAHHVCVFEPMLHLVLYYLALLRE
jgi:hypothetical protein